MEDDGHIEEQHEAAPGEAVVREVVTAEGAEGVVDLGAAALQPRHRGPGQAGVVAQHRVARGDVDDGGAAVRGRRVASVRPPRVLHTQA